MNLYKDKDWLYQKYIKERLPAWEMVRLAMCGNSTIRRWLEKFGIPIRNPKEARQESSKQGRASTYWKGKKGKNHPKWKGGEIIDSRGYILARMPKHPKADGQGYVRRSHLIAEKMLGRYLFPNEITHHKNGIKDDDRPENIEVTTRERHMDFHRSTNGSFISGVTTQA